MKSLKELYKIGCGPSSSHTMGPSKAAEIYALRHPDAGGFEVTLFGGTPAQIEYAAEMGLEHHLGMTCRISIRKQA